MELSERRRTFAREKRRGKRAESKARPSARNTARCFVSLEVSLFPSIFVPLPFFLCMESTSYVFPLRMVLFYLVTTGWIFLFLASAYVRIQSIKQSSNALTKYYIISVYNNYNERKRADHLDSHFKCQHTWPEMIAASQYSTIQFDPVTSFRGQHRVCFDCCCIVLLCR